MHRRIIAKAVLMLLSLVVFLGGGSTVHVTQGAGVEDADTRSAPRSLGTSLATADGAMEWNQTYGGSGRDEAYSVIQTADGGFALAGSTKSFGTGDEDSWLVKTDAHGKAQWTQTYGGSSFDRAYAVIQTADGGFALAGQTHSYGAGLTDAWLVKTDGNGMTQWSRTYGGAMSDSTKSVIQTTDGGFALAGTTSSYGAGLSDFWLVKTDGRGAMEWTQTYGGAGYELVHAAIQTADGGFALAGMTESFGAGKTDFWLVKTDTCRTLEWQRAYGFAGYELETCFCPGREQAYAIIQTADGGFALAGRTGSLFGTDDFDIWLVKTDARGNQEWQE